MRIDKTGQYYNIKKIKTTCDSHKALPVNNICCLEKPNKPDIGAYGKYIVFKGSLKNSKPEPDIGKKLNLVRKEMQDLNLDALFVASTDNYLNEFVDRKESQREYISGFTGSVGDVIITDNTANLFVDSRYHIQADEEVDHQFYTVEKIGLDKHGMPVPEDSFIRMAEFLKKLSEKKKISIGYDPNKISIKDITYLKHLANKVSTKVKFIPVESNIIDKIRDDKPELQSSEVRVISDDIAGESTVKKLNRLNKKLQQEKINCCVISNLFDIAYLTNLRGSDIPYSSTFKAKAIFNDGKLTVFCNQNNIPEKVKTKLKDHVDFLPENEFETNLNNIGKSNNKPEKIAFFQDETTDRVYKLLKQLVKDDIRVVELKTNPVLEMRSVKNDEELYYYTEDLQATDKALTEVINWLNCSVNQGIRITEADLEKVVELSHKKYGAINLSFPTIPATGSNTAKAHYMKSDPEKVIMLGDLVLVDTGGFYKTGLSTDLTRTWIAGGEEGIKYLEENEPEKLNKIKKFYSIVLKSILKVMDAELPPNATGKTIESMCSRTYSDFGLTQDYGIGHGIGINVHEFPPYIDSCDHGYCDTKLKNGMVFAIEPGYYDKDLGGIRLENIVKVKEHSDPEKAKKGWHEINCLSYTPIEMGLIDKSIFDEIELKKIENYNKYTLLNLGSVSAINFP